MKGRVGGGHRFKSSLKKENASNKMTRNMKNAKDEKEILALSS